MPPPADPQARPPRLVVRPASVEDADSLARVHTVAWQQSYAGLLPQDFLDGLDWRRRRERWREQLTATSAGTVLVAEEAGSVVGFVSFGPARDADLAEEGWQELYAIYLVPERWRAGIGRRLWQAARAAMPSEVPGVCVWLLAGNTSARTAYAAWGFVADGATMAVEIGGASVDEVRMRWRGAR